MATRKANMATQIYAVQTFTATDGTSCVKGNTYTLTDSAAFVAYQKGQAQPASLQEDVNLSTLNQLQYAAGAKNVAGVGNGKIFDEYGEEIQLGSATSFSPNTDYYEGESVTYCGALYTFTSDHPAGNWTGADVEFVRQVDGKKTNTIGVYKRTGMQAQFTPGTVNTSSGASPNTRSIKQEVEAPFYRVRVGSYNKEALPLSGMGFSFAQTETAALDTVNNAMNPIVGGVTYRQFASNSGQYGFRPVTWGGATRSPIQYPATATPNATGYYTDYDAVWSDWCPVQSVPRADVVGARELLLGRYNRNTTTGEALSNVATGVMTSEYARYAAADPTMPGRLTYYAVCGTNDQVADPTLSQSGAVLADPTTNNVWINIAFQCDHAIPTRAFLVAGDSYVEGYNWQNYFVYTLSTRTAPCTIQNLGFSTNRSEVYLSAAKIALRDPDNVITDVMIPDISYNNLTPTLTANAVQLLQAELLDFIQVCKERGVRLFIWTNPIEKTGGGQPVASLITPLHNWVRDMAANGDFYLMEVTDGWDNATMISGDNVHPNELGQQFFKTRALAAVQVGI